MSEKEQARTWALVESGDPPLLWALKYWPPVVMESKFLTPQQYWHMADQLLDAARTDNPCQCATIRVAQIEDFWELKDKGGPLGKINLRVFFCLNTAAGRREIVVLGVHKKEDEDQLRRSVVVRIARRRRKYIESITPTKE